MITLDTYRKSELQDLAEAISMEFFPQRAFDPGTVADHYGITYSYGNYGVEKSFDGLLQHQSGRFHIFLNLDRQPDIESPRMRYTFCHELGHYFIDEHRNALKKGDKYIHKSLSVLMSHNKAEREADYFASCLLMPSAKVRGFCHRCPLSGQLIDDLSRHFQTSTSATLFRYFDIGMFPMAIVMSKAGKIEWKWFTRDFKYWGIPAEGCAVPVNTAVWEYFNSGKRYKTDEIVFADDWFNDHNRIKDEQFYEKCYYPGPDKVMSVIWKKEK